MPDMIAVTFAQKFCDVPARKDGTPAHRLGYLEWSGAAADAPAVLCVHGLTRNAHDFDFLAAALARDFRVFAADMPGRGYSDWLEDKSRYTYATYVADCLTLLDHLKLERTLWIGTSMGGILGMTLAAMRPERIAGLVLNDVGKRIPREAMERIVAYAGEKHIFSSHDEAEEFLREITAPFGITDPMRWRRFAERSIWEIQPGTFILAWDPEILTPYREETENFTKIDDIDLSGAWDAVTCPVLLLRGANSDLLTPGVAERMAQEKPGVTLVTFPKVGHAPALMDDHQIATVKEWLLARSPEQPGKTRE